MLLCFHGNVFKHVAVFSLDRISYPYKILSGYMLI